MAAMNRDKWLAAVASLISPSFPADAFEALKPMLPHLPEGAFIAETIPVVATACPKGVPSLAQVQAALGDYRRSRMPAHVRMGGVSTIGQAVERIAAPEIPKRTQAELDHVERQRAMIVAELRANVIAKANAPKPKACCWTHEQTLDAIRRGVWRNAPEVLVREAMAKGRVG